MPRQHTQIVTQPSLEPLTLPEAKLHLRETSDTQDGLIWPLIRVAREEVERLTGRATLTTTYRDVLDAFPPYTTAIAWSDNRWSGLDLATRSPYAIHLMRSPLLAVSSVQYYDGDGTLQTLNAANYVTDATMEPGRVAPAAGFSWPATQSRPGAVRINYTAGYATAAAMPASVIHAMRLLVGHWYENRETVLVGTISKEIEFGVMSLTDKVRVMWEW
jgi:uncharacterized phiE125 gp8 family phage protein